MNRKEFKKSMSGVQPSEMTIERIMNMTEKKNRFAFNRSLIGVLVVIAILIFGGIVVNAASDGAVSDYISNGADYINKSIKVLINGKEVDAQVYETTKIDEDGNVCKDKTIVINEDVYVELEEIEAIAATAYDDMNNADRISLAICQETD